MSGSDEKRALVFAAAYDVFSRYGFRRTSMNDVAQAAGISRPALYLLFQNKEHLFLELVSYRLAQAIAAAEAALADGRPLQERLIDALLAHEAVLYEPVSESPHGAELMDVGESIASEHIRAGHEQLVEGGEAALDDLDLAPAAFVELLLASVMGIKKTSPANAAFRRDVRAVGTVFMKAVCLPRKRASRKPRRRDRVA